MCHIVIFSYQDSCCGKLWSQNVGQSGLKLLVKVLKSYGSNMTIVQTAGTGRTGIRELKLRVRDLDEFSLNYEAVVGILA